MHNADSDVWEMSIRLRPYIESNNKAAKYFGKHKNIGISSKRNVGSENQELSSMESAPKHLILSYVAQIKMICNDNESCYGMNMERSYTVVPRL